MLMISPTTPCFCGVPAQVLHDCTWRPKFASPSPARLMKLHTTSGDLDDIRAMAESASSLAAKAAALVADLHEMLEVEGVIYATNIEQSDAAASSEAEPPDDVPIGPD